MIYWEKNCIIYIPISNEYLRYERYIFLVLEVSPFTNHVFDLIFPKNGHLNVIQ
jgi:hypothetical protein